MCRVLIVVHSVNVPLQSARLGESHVADCADEGSYIFVAHVMHNETRTFIKDFVAAIELANEGSFLQVFTKYHRLLFIVLLRQTLHIQSVVILLHGAHAYRIYLHHSGSFIPLLHLSII